MVTNWLLMNPYQGLTFISFISHFIKRMSDLVLGRLSIEQLVSDEIQVLVLIGVAISCALVGTFLILRRMTMLANSLSHTILMGIVLAYVMTRQTSDAVVGTDFLAPMEAMLLSSLIVGFLTVFLTEFLTKAGRLQEDASTGLIFTSMFALGVILVTILTKNAHIGTEVVMGNADALHRDDLFWVYCIGILNILLVCLFFKEYKITTFDSALAYSMGISPFIFSYLLMSQVSMTTIISFRAIGVLLVLAFMTGPSLAARLCTHNLKYLLVIASIFGSMCAFIGVALTRHILTVYAVALSTSGVVVSTILAFYTCIVIIAPKSGLIAHYCNRRSLFRLDVKK